MKFLLIGREAHTLPYAIEITEETLEKALVSTAELEEGRNLFQPEILVDLDTGETKRLIKRNNRWDIHDSAFVQNLGHATPYEYFDDEVTVMEESCEP